MSLLQGPVDTNVNEVFIFQETILEEAENKHLVIK